MSPGDALRQARDAARITQRDLATLMDITPAYLNDIEHGRRELLEKYVDKLPQNLASDVAAAMIAVHQEAINRLLLFVPCRQRAAP
jgi:transcriptional regulator with XRE-family HTH domain